MKERILLEEIKLRNTFIVLLLFVVLRSILSGHGLKVILFPYQGALCGLIILYRLSTLFPDIKEIKKGGVFLLEKVMFLVSIVLALLYPMALLIYALVF